MSKTLKPGEGYDKKGIPIWPGDLLRSFHFRERRYRRKHYLYHVAVLRNGYLMIVPTSHLELQYQHSGGICGLTQDLADSMEILSGHGPKPDYLDFRDRPKVKRPGSLSSEAEPQSPGPGDERRSE